MPNKYELEKPYIVSLTANDAYEQDCFQARLSQSPDTRQREIAINMNRIFHKEAIKETRSQTTKAFTK